MAGNQNPAEPTPNSEKFKPQNVADPQTARVDPSQRRNENRPADTGGHDVPRGSEPETQKSGG